MIYSVMYIMVTLFVLFISFVHLYRVEDACKIKTCEFRLSICFHSRSSTTLTALARFA